DRGLRLRVKLDTIAAHRVVDRDLSRLHLRVVRQHLRRRLTLDTRAALTVAIQMLTPAPIDAVAVDEVPGALEVAHAREGRADVTHESRWLGLSERRLRADEADDGAER